MDLEQQIAEAVKAELDRQAAEGGLKVGGGEAGRLNLQGDIDLDALAMAIAGAVAGGP